MSAHIFLRCFCAFFGLRSVLVFAASIPSNVDICHKSDPNFNKCLSTQMAKALHEWKDGIPELGIPKLEPFEIPKLEIIGEKKESIALDQKYEHLLTYGIYISELYDAKFNMKPGEDCTWDFWALSPHISMVADYELKGQILIFPINAHGKCNITITNLRNRHRAWCERYQKKGKTHLRITKYVVDFGAEQVHFDFENLIPGNKKISDDMLRSINENSMSVFSDVKGGFEKVWSSLHLQTTNNLLSRIPEEDIFPE